MRRPTSPLPVLAGLILVFALPNRAVAAETVPLEKLTWTHRNPRPIGQGLAGFLGGPAGFVAYGGGGLILHSANGVFWDVVPVPQKDSWIAAQFVEGEFLLGGGTTLLTSPDGRTWTTRTLPPPPNNPFTAIYDATRRGVRWAVNTYDGIYVSDDGASWEIWPYIGLGGFNRVAIGPDRILVVRTLFTATTVVSYTGPNTWTETPAPFLDSSSPLYHHNGQFVASGPGGIGFSVDGASWEVVPLPAGAYYPSLRRHGDVWSLTSLGWNWIYQSTDARNWTALPCAAFSQVGYVARTEPGIWVATGDHGGIATSIDGVTWIRRDSGIAPTMHAMAQIAGRWVAVGQQGTVLSSVDGLTWDKTVLGTDHFFSLIADPAVLYARGDQSTAFITTDGVNWSPAAALPPTQWDFSSVPDPYVPWHTPTWVGDRWLLQANIPRVGAGALFSSTDGQDWTMVLQSGLFIVSVAGRPGDYVACNAAGGGLLYSTDTLHWESIPSELMQYQTPNVVLEGHGWFLAGTTGGILASQNGRDWQWLPGITSQIYGGARLGESFWFTGEGGTIIEVMPHLEAPIANLSTRAYQRDGGLPAIAGFIIEGSEPVDVLVRAVGAGLRDYDVDEVVERPTLHLFEGRSETMAAGDWATSAARAEIEAATQRIGAFELKEDGGDAAFVARLPAGAYTAIVQGGTVAQGNVLVEVYDGSGTRGASDGGRLANSSTRGEATAEHPLIGGLIVSGEHPRRVLVRGIGPGLLDYDVPGAAADPRLAIYREQDVIAENDDWGAVGDPLLTIDAAAASHAFALADGSLDAAIVVTLAPGRYTVHVAPAKDTAGGEVLLETYYLD